MAFFQRITTTILLVIALQGCNIYKVDKFYVLEDSNEYYNLTDFSYLSKEIYFLKNKKAINSIIKKRIKLAYKKPYDYKGFLVLHTVKNAIHFDNGMGKNKYDLLNSLTKIDSVFVIYNIKKREYKFINYKDISPNIDKYKENIFTYYIYELVRENEILRERGYK